MSASLPWLADGGKLVVQIAGLISADCKVCGRGRALGCHQEPETVLLISPPEGDDDGGLIVDADST
jgi:hypothetical protein